MHVIQILPYILSVFSYLIPICCFLPFKLKFKQKALLFYFTNKYSHDWICSRQYWCNCINFKYMHFYLLDCSWAINKRLYIYYDLSLCVLWDNLYSLLWDTYVYPITDLQSHTIYYIIFISFQYFLLERKLFSSKILYCLL